MKLYVDLESLQLIEGPGFRNPVTSLRFKRGDAALLEVSFLEGGVTPVSLGNPLDLTIRFGVKPRNRYDIGYLVHSADWTMPDTEAENPVYQCSPSFNTVELDSALGVGSSTGSELSEITLMGEITWSEGTGEPTSTRTFLVVVENDVNRGTEGVPVQADPPYPPPQGIELVARKGAANGYAGLDSGGKVPAAQLAINAASISDSTTTGRALVKAASAASARSTIGALAAPSSAGDHELRGLSLTSEWVGITMGHRAVLSSPYQYADYQFPPFFKGLALFVLTDAYGNTGYTLADLMLFMESFHGSTLWNDLRTLNPGSHWITPGFAVLNDSESHQVLVDTTSTIFTSQISRAYPGAGVYLEPRGMAFLRLLESPSLSGGFISIHGDLTSPDLPAASSY